MEKRRSEMQQQKKLYAVHANPGAEVRSVLVSVAGGAPAWDEWEATGGEGHLGILSRGFKR